MSRQIEFAPEEFYHLYNRGVEKRTIYLDKADHERFLNLLYLANNTNPIHLQKIKKSAGDSFGRGPTSTKSGSILSTVYSSDREETLVDIVSYCLMPNHFHILVRGKNTGGISKFIQKLGTGYTMYFNKRYDRNGALFQGKFKATHVNTDPYLKYLSSYIHLNPVKLIQSDWKEFGVKDMQAAQNKLDNYRYSSYLEYKGTIRPENSIINRSAYPLYFDTIKELESEMQDWLSLQEEGTL